MTPMEKKFSSLGYTDARVIVKNAKVIAGTEFGLDAHGVYDKYGGFVLNSSLYQGGRLRSGQAKHRDFPSNMSYLSGNYAYGGYISGHFGHILLETFSRAYLFKETEVPILFCEENHTNSDLFFKIMSALQMDVSRVEIIKTPTVIESIFVDAPTFSIRNFSQPKYIKALECIGGNLFHCDNTPSKKQNLYLSRSSLRSDGRYYFGEKVIEAILERSGYEIYFPEKKSVYEQVTSILYAKKIVGFWGSAFHPIVFSSNSKDIVYLHCEPINENFLLIEDLKKNSWKEVFVEHIYRESTTQVKLLSKAGIIRAINSMSEEVFWDSDIEGIYQGEVEKFHQASAAPA